MQKKTPVTIITGFLGAGKTTLVNRLIEKQGSERVGIIVNEFGEVGIDGQLIIADEEALIEINNGCICCTVRTDLVAGAKEILARTVDMPLDRIIVETSGMADPAPILQTFLVDPDLKMQLDVESVVTVVDARHFPDQMKEELVREQVAFADVVVLNKADLVTPGEVEKCHALAQALNPTADFITSVRASIDYEMLLGVKRFSLPGILEIEPDLLDDSHDHEHDDSIQSFSIIEEQPLDGHVFERWINQLVIKSGNDILRMKGIMNFHGERRQFYFHSIHMVLEGQPGPAWKEGQLKQSKIVFIGRNLDTATLELGVRGCVKEKKELSVASLS